MTIRVIRIQSRLAAAEVDVSLVLVGLDHRLLSFAVLEQVAMSGERQLEALDLLMKSDHVTEAVVLSTCMRTEIYLDAVRFHGAVDDAYEVLAQMSGLSVEMFDGAHIEFFDEAARTHLFRVAAGLESAVLGESEVLGQVARAWETARAHGSCRTILGGLFRHAVVAGKRARHQTAIARGITSIGQAAVVMASSAFGTMEAKRVLVVGTGDMGARMAVALADTEGVGEVMVCNRTPERAAVLAERVGASTVAWDALASTLSDVDLLLTSTGSTEPILATHEVRAAMQARADRPLVIVDVAVPRDVEASAAEVPGVTVLGLDDLRTFADRAHAGRASEVAAVEDIVEEEALTYAASVNARLVTPVVRALRDRAEEVRLTEIERHASRLAELSPVQRELVDQITRSTLAKLLHDPTVRLKEMAGTPDGERMADSLRRLFGV